MLFRGGWLLVSGVELWLRIECTCRYVNEMVRVLKPGGALAVATWCQREETPEAPLSQKDRSNLQFLYDEWAHPHFVSYQEYMRIMHRTGAMTDIQVLPRRTRRS